MKFINYLESISGISVFPMISLLVFFAFFMLLFVRVYYLNKNTISEISNLPLEGEEPQTSNHIN
jgi:cytochrome c oxidase cbb3-type subunit 3